MNPPQTSNSKRNSLKNCSSKENHEFDETLPSKVSMVPRPGFEPGARARKGAGEASSDEIGLNALWSQHKRAFEEWLSVKLATEETKERYMRYLERFFGKYKITDKGSLDEALVKEGYNRG
ncbi:MAG: hypothetical protein ABGW50_04655, partial [Thermococcus sp.]